MKITIFFLAVADIDDLNFVQYPKNFSSFNLNRNEKLDKKAEELYKNRTIFIEGYFSAVKDILSSENIKLKKKIIMTFPMTIPVKKHL